MKTCSKCKEEKQLIDFAKTGRREGLFASLCKPCSSKKASAWNKNNPEKRRLYSRRNKLKKQYGISPEQYDEMIKSQEAKCLICEKNRKLVIDHNHKTGEVRGLLCNQCNAGIGYFYENPSIMKKAIKYVIKNS